MALIRFRPFSNDLSDIQTQMNRLFDSFMGQPGTAEALERVWAPAADMYETKNEVEPSSASPRMATSVPKAWK